jgi:hypothetical protein
MASITFGVYLLTLFGKLHHVGSEEIYKNAEKSNFKQNIGLGGTC